MANRSVTIIVPSYKDWERLALCVEALAAQSYPSELINVILVNNDPKDTAPADFYIPTNFRIVTEGKPGSYAARNAALKIAEGDIIGFTDSDCIPDKDWIKNAVDYFNQNDSCSRIAGRVLVFPKSPKPTPAEKYDKLYAFRQKRYVTNSGTCVTANLFTYRYVFDKVGFFNDTQMSYGDLDWGKKAHEAGYRIDYVENVMVHHPARGLDELIKKEKRLAGGREKTGNRKYNKLAVYSKFLKEARPRIRGPYRFIKANGQGFTATDRLSVLFIKLLLNYVRAYETMRLRLGKKPNRT